MYRLGVASRLDCAEIAGVEQVADQMPGGPLNRYHVWLRRYTQLRGQAGSVADNRGVLALDAPTEITNDRHRRRDADPAPHRHFGAASHGLDRRAQFEPRPDRPLGVVFVRRGIAKKGDHDFPETADDKPVVALDRLFDAALKGADHLAQLIETDAVDAPRHADWLARHGGDLAAFGVSMRRGCEVPRRALPRRHDAFLRFRYDRPDEPIPAAEVAFDPAVPARLLAENPAQS
jgi:hypothetical protein